MQRVATTLQILALIALSAFSCVLLFIAFVLVKFWESVEPNVFLSWMAEHFFRFPTIMVPLNGVALLMTIAVLATSWKTLPASRLPWSLGLLCLMICTATFAIYFVGANTEFVTGSIELSDVASQLNEWSNWHWTRTGLATLAVIFAAWGLYKQEQLNSAGKTSD